MTSHNGFDRLFAWVLLAAVIILILIFAFAN